MGKNYDFVYFTREGMSRSLLQKVISYALLQFTI